MHPDRFDLHNELHARPSIYFQEPANVFHLTLLEQEHSLELLVQSLSPGTEGQLQGLLSLDGCAMKWERHSEFLSLTLVVPRVSGDKPWVNPPQGLQRLIANYEHLLIESSQILVVSEADWKGQAIEYGFKDPAGSEVGAGDAIVWSDFRLTEDGYNRLLLVNRRLNAYRLGRMVRRLLEIETYRMMASLALPVAKEVAARLKEHERTLTLLSTDNANQEGSDARQILADISALSARVVRCNARTRQRFSAAEAYAQIVFERIAELREQHVSGYQRLGVFIERRFRPTVRYCSATCQRLERLSNNVANLGELLQARVQVEVEQQNCAILQSLNARAHAQIRIQKAVEGLSIIAISYYLLSLFKLLYEGLHGLGLPVTPKIAALYIFPVAFISLVAVAHRIHKAKRE